MITYNLNIDGQNYEDYYSTLKRLKKMIIDKDCNKSKKYIDDFKIYINNFEITLGYGVSKVDKHRIQNIVREFNRRNNAHITIKNSELKIRSN